MKIAINGFGRIGRTFFRAAHKLGLNIVAINDLVDNLTLAHLLKYDSTYGEFEPEVNVKGDKLVVGTKEIVTLSEKDATKLPWKDLGIETVVESTGAFTEYDLAYQHIKAGAKRVVLSAPAKGERKVKTFVYGVNEKDLNKSSDQVISMASCTTNCLVPIIDVLEKNFKILKSSMSTVHSITMDQVLQDSPHKDLRRARAALQSIIPTTTGATTAAIDIFPNFDGKMNGLSFRVPTPTVSIIDFVALVEKPTNVEAVNNVFKKAADDPSYKGALAVTDKELVGADFRGNPAGSIVDLNLTQVIDNDLVKVVSWYDNEMGYSIRLAEFVKYIQG